MTAAPTAAKAEGLLTQVPTSAPSGEPAWLTERREAAIQHLRETGFPRKKDEAWRFTSVREVVGTPFRRADPRTWSEEEVQRVALRLPEPSASAASRFWMFGGRPVGAAAEPPAKQLHLGGIGYVERPGVRVTPLRHVLEKQPERVAAVLASLAPNTAFSALNSALFDDGVVVEVDPGVRVESTLEVNHFDGVGSPHAAFPRLLVLAGEGSELRLVERFLGDEFHNGLTCPVTEVHLAPGARVDHVRAALGSAGPQLAHLAVRLERDAHYASRVVTLGGRLSRLDLNVAFAGPGAEAVLDGVFHATTDDHVDHQLFVDHAVDRCTSRVTYRGLLAGRGRAVFNAVGAVRSGTVGSAVHQENRNLLLSDDAVIDTKPHLEIESDDVTASHGTAIGALNRDQLYYLRTRGLPEEHARAMLTFAFVQELLGRIPDPDIAHELSTDLLGYVPDSDSIRELLA